MRICTSWLVVDQLNLEKKGIPTVTVATTAFEEMVGSLMKDQGVSEMAWVVEEHPLRVITWRGSGRKWTRLSLPFLRPQRNGNQGRNDGKKRRTDG